MTISYNMEKKPENIHDFVRALRSTVMHYSSDFVDGIPENFRGLVPGFDATLTGLTFGSEGKRPVLKMVGSNLYLDGYAAKIRFYATEYYEKPEYSGFNRIIHAIKEYVAPKPEIPPPPKYLCAVTVNSDTNIIEFEAGLVEASEEDLAQLVDAAFEEMIQKPFVMDSGNITVS